MPKYIEIHPNRIKLVNIYYPSLLKERKGLPTFGRVEYKKAINPIFKNKLKTIDED